MRKLIVVGLFLLAEAAVAQAVVIPSGSLPYNARTASCEEILKHENKNRATKLMAAGVYAHGKHMGKSCMKPDYVRAFNIYRELQQYDQANAILRRLEKLANKGRPSAKRALRELKQAGHI